MACKRFVVIVFCMWASHSSFGNPAGRNEPKTIKEFEVNLQNMVRSISKQVFPQAYRIISESNVSMGCSLAFSKLFADSRNLKEWSLRMLDASAKPAAGILDGALLMFGDYEECLDIVVTNAAKKAQFRGKYCLLGLGVEDNILQNATDFRPQDMKHPTKVQLWGLMKAGRNIIPNAVIAAHLGLCVPSTCSAQEINRIANVGMRRTGFTASVTCKTRTKKEPNTVQIILLCIFAVFGFLIVIGTSLDVMNQHSNMKTKSGELSKLLISFSFYSNTIRLFSTYQHDSSLSAIRGCRVLLSLWIVLTHVYFLPIDFFLLKFHKLKQLMEFSEELTFHFISSGAASLDTFFIISATLFVYSSWRTLEKNKGWINPFTLVLFKTTRLLPSMMITIALFIIAPLCGDGPIWDQTVTQFNVKCEKYWWANLLFIQNFWNTEDGCAPHMWYLSSLLQLLMLASVIIMVLYRWPKLGIFINLLLILIGCFVIWILTSVYDLPSSLSLITYNIESVKAYGTLIHVRPYTYFCSFFTGILLGYTIVVKRSSKIKPRTQFLAWSVSIFGALGVLYSVHFFEKSKEFRMAYAVLHRIVWSSSVSWMLFACLTGRGGIVGRLLSWKGMIPLDRMALYIYLLHPLVLVYYTARARAASYMDHVEQAFTFIATCGITVGISYFTIVTFESPVKYILSLITRKLSSKRVAPDVMHANFATQHANKLTLFQETAAFGEHIPSENNASKL